MTTGTTGLPLSLFWALEAGCALTLALLLGLALTLRRWPGSPPWLRQTESSGMLRGLVRLLLMGAMGTTTALLLLVAGVQLGQLTTRSIDAPTLFNLELAGLLLAALLHLLLSCLWPLRHRTTTVRPPTPHSQQQTRREDTQWRW